MTHSTKSSRREIYANSTEGNRQEVETLLQSNVYADKDQWKRFLNLSLPALGVSLLVSGIIFFFAYNWAELSAFVKLGLMEGVLAATVALVLFTPWSQSTKQIILTGASFLVGALFAVYGQVYQTGANAYEFFLGWTLFVTLWTIASGYPPLWLVWIGLVHITIHLYCQQMLSYDDELYYILHNTQTLILAICTVSAECWYAAGNNRRRATWFVNTIALAAILWATWCLSDSILLHNKYWLLSGPIALAIFIAGLWYGKRKRLLFYMAAIPFCALLTLESLLIKVFQDDINAGLFLLLGLVLAAGTTAIVYLIIELKKQWYGTATE